MDTDIRTLLLDVKAKANAQLEKESEQRQADEVHHRKMMNFWNISQEAVEYRVNHLLGSLLR